MFLAYIKLLKKNTKSVVFLKYHFATILIFGVLYWIQDNYFNYYPQELKTVGFESTNNQLDRFGYWLWFSAITQTTVGYGNPEITCNHKNMFKILNCIQLCSIIFITSLIV